MLKVNQNKVEKFFDILDQSATILHNETKKNYLESLIMTAQYILEAEINNDDLHQETRDELESIYQELEGASIHKEEIRKAFQLCLLKGFKHVNTSLSYITPDSMGILFSYLVDQFFESSKSINILDASVGTGNLLITLLNNSSMNFNKIFGVDVNYNYLNLALTLADLTNYDIEFVNQDSTHDLVIPKFELIVADLPYYDVNKQYLPYKMVSNLMNYCMPGGYFIYLIPNDFFEREGNAEMRAMILEHTHIQALITLPSTMFKTKSAQKTILVLQKRSEDITPSKEILLMNFPSFQDPKAVKQAMGKINMWFDKKRK